MSRPNATEKRHFLCSVEKISKLSQRGIGRANGWALRHRSVDESVIGHGQGSDISGKGNDCNTLFANCRLHRNLECAWHLLRVRNKLAVVAAFLKQSFWMGLLKVHRA